MGTDNKSVLLNLVKELEKASSFKKIRLAYALHNKTLDLNSALYRIRNGKSFVKDITNVKERPGTKTLALMMNTIVTGSIIEDLEKNVKGKIIKVDKNVQLALPSTEKQFVGNVPSGTCVTLTKDMIVGVHWNNVDYKTIDLDFSTLSVAGKLGWNTSYRSNDRQMLFSGDITDAPNGASEIFYFGKGLTDAMLMVLNYYNYNGAGKVPVPFDLFIGEEPVAKLDRKYMINPNHVISTSKSVMDVKEKIVGLVISTPETQKFFFIDTCFVLDNLLILLIILLTSLIPLSSIKESCCFNATKIGLYLLNTFANSSYLFSDKYPRKSNNLCDGKVSFIAV